MTGEQFDHHEHDGVCRRCGNAWPCAAAILAPPRYHSDDCMDAYMLPCRCGVDALRDQKGRKK